MPIETYSPDAVNGIRALPQDNISTTIIHGRSTSQDKINDLSTKIQDKVATLSRGDQIAQNIEKMDETAQYKPAMLQEVGDSDSPVLVGDTRGRRLAGDPTINEKDPSGWVDSLETMHGKFSNDPKEIARVERQRQQHGLKSIDDVFKGGERQRLEYLYNMMGRPIGEDGKEWTPGPIEYEGHVPLGSKDDPLNIPVQIRETGGISHNRDVTYIKDASGKINQSAELAKQGYLSKPDSIQSVNSQSFTPDELARQYDEAIAKRRAADSTSSNGFLEGLGKAAVAGFAKSGYDIADTGVELVGDLADRATGGRFGLDKKMDLGTDDQKTETVNKLVGYDDSKTKANTTKIGKLYDEIFKDSYILSPSTWKNIDYEKIPEMVGTAFATPETAAYSVGYMVPALAGLFEKGAIKVAGTGVKQFAKESVDVMKDATLNNVAKAEKIADLKNKLSVTDKTKLFMAENADALAYGGMMNNNEMDEFINANGGEEPSLSRMMLGTALDTIGMKLDIHTANAVMHPKDTGIILTEMFKGMDENVAGKVVSKLVEMGTKLAAAGFKEMPQEFIQEGISAFNKVYGANVNGQEVGVVPAALGSIKDATVGSVMGLAGGVHMATPAVALENAKSAYKTTGEYLTDKFDNPANNEDNELANSIYGRKNRFHTDVTNVAPEARPAWTKDISTYASELWLSENEKKGTEYEKEPSKIFTDAVDQLAKLNGIDSKEGKDIIQNELLRNALALGDEKSDSTGKFKASAEDKESLIKTLINTFKGNPLVENTIDKNYKDELARKFEDVRARLNAEGVNTKDLSSKGLLTEEELANLETTLASMRKLGSEELTNTANEISSALTSRQERLGSENTGDGNVPPKKNSLEVDKEIETLGFLTKGYNSIKDYARDLNTDVINPIADKADRDATLDALGRFVASRADKVDIYDVKKGDNDKARVRSIGEIKSFAESNIKNNLSLLSVINNAIEKTTNEESKVKLMSYKAHLDEVQSKLYEIVHSDNSTEGDIALYQKLAGQSKGFNVVPKHVLEDYLAQYKNEWGDKHKQTSSNANKTDTESPINEQAVTDTLENIEPDNKSLTLEDDSPIDDKTGVQKTLDLFTSGVAKSIGGGYVENVINKDGYKISDIDEDVKAGEIVKGFKESSVQELLPYISNIKSIQKAVTSINAGKGTDSDLALVEEFKNEINKFVKYEPEMADQLGIESFEDTPTSTLNANEELIPQVLRSKIDNSTDENVSSTKQNAELDNDNSSDIRKYSKDDIEFIKKMIESGQKDIDEAQAIVDLGEKSNESVKKISEKLNDVNQEIRNRIDTVKSLKKVLNSHRVALKDMLKTLEGSEKQNTMLSNIIANYDKDISSLNKKVDLVLTKMKDNDNDFKRVSTLFTTYIKDRVLKEFKTLMRNLVKKLDTLLNKLRDTERKKTSASEIQSNLVNSINQLKAEIAARENDINTLEDIKESTQEEINDMTTTRSSLKRELQDAKVARDNLLAMEGLDVEQVKIYRDKLIGLKKVVKEYKDVVDNFNTYRQGIESALGSVIVPNMSKKQSLSNKLFNDEDLMKVMPNIIRKNEKGQEMIDSAKDVFVKFESDRADKLMNQDNKSMEAVLVNTGLSKLFSDKNIESQVKKAMNVASIVTLGNMIDLQTLNSEELDTFVEGAFGGLITSANYDGKDTMLESIKNDIRSGKYVPLPTFYREAGLRLLQELEIKVNFKTLQEKDDAARALGAIVVNNILPNRANMNSIKIKTGVMVVEDGIFVARDKASEKAKTAKEAKANIKQTENDEITDTKNISDSVGILWLDGLSKDYKYDINVANRVFEYAGEKGDGSINFSPTKYEYDRRGRNSNVPLTKAEVDYLNKQNEMPWKFDKSFENIWNEADRDIDTLVTNILGTKEDILKDPKISIAEVESKLAKYDADVLDIERMIMAYELAGDKEFYINWDYTVSNRSMMSNKMINPQNSKVSRFIVNAEGMRNKPYKSKDLSKDLLMVNLAIAQAFDKDPDKLLDEDAVKKVKDELVNISIENGKLVATFTNSKLQDIVETSDNILGDLRTKMKIGSAHLLHAYQVVDFLRNMHKPDFETNLALEMDGITNGMASTIAEMGLNADTSAFFEKVGFYIDGHTDVSSHGEFKQKGGKDFYQQPIESFIEDLKDFTIPAILNTPDNKLPTDIVEQIITGGDTLNDNKWRSFLKPLVMVFAYGASSHNIGLKGSADFVNKMFVHFNDVKDKEGHSKGKDTTSLKILIKQFNEIASEVIPYTDKNGRKAISIVTEYLKSTPESYSYDLKDGKYVKDNNGRLYADSAVIGALAVVVNASIGNSLIRSFNKEFSAITEYRTTLKTINELNYLVSNIAFKEKAKEIAGVNSYHELTEEQLQRITDEMIKDGTYYGSINPNGGMQDYFKTKNDAEFKNETITVNLGPAFSSFKSSTGYGRDINKLVKTLASNVGAVGVIDIHSIDGNTMITGHIKDVLNIFDALVMGTNYDSNNEQAKAINDAYYKILMEHSIVGNAVEKLLADKSFKTLISKVDDNMDINLAKDINEDINRIFGGSANKSISPEDLSERLEAIKDSLIGIDNSRKALIDSKATMKQYYISDAFEAGTWSKDSMPKDKRYAVYANTEEMTKMEQLLTNLIETYRIALGKIANAEQNRTIDVVGGIKEILDTLPDNVKEEMQKWLSTKDKDVEGCL